ncbi:MAG: nucleotidyltransferase domain-containing protein [Candidatus Margulisiibacteriota bacterium]|jgi:hypothetical protein
MLKVQAKPTTPLHLAQALTIKQGCVGSEFSEYRIGLARGLAAMRGPTTVYQEKDIEALWSIKTLFQNYTGISRENENQPWNSAYQIPLLQAHDEWTTNKGVRGPTFTSVIKALCRPSTNAEIRENYDRLGGNLQSLYTVPFFFSLALSRPHALGIVGSLASGNFGAFSDLDLAVSPGLLTESVRERLRSKIRYSEADLFIYSEGYPVIWLNRDDHFFLRQQPDYLRRLVSSRLPIPN